MSRPIRLVESDNETAGEELQKLIDRLETSMGHLGIERPDVVALTAAFLAPQASAFRGSCASLGYSEAEMIRRDLRGANNPTVGMFILRLLARPNEVRESLAVLCRAAGGRFVVDDAPRLSIHEAKAALGESHAALQALIDRGLANDGVIDETEGKEIHRELVKVSDRLARVGQATSPKGRAE